MRKPATGEPYAGKPPVRFGGRGGLKPSLPLSKDLQQRRNLQQFRLLRHDGIADGDVATGDYLGINSALVVAKSLHQGLRDGEVARATVRIDVDGGAAGDRLDHLQPRVADREGLAD